MIEVSDRIWEYAEVGLQEFRSSALLAEELEKSGFRVQRGVAGMPTAFIASFGEGRPIIGILGEYDALPGISQKPIARREPLIEGAPGHGCGHNIHGASGTYGAIAVKVCMEAEGIKGTLKFFGCPAEETLIGKVFMAREGVFDGLDAVVSHHPGQMNAATLISHNAMNSAKFHFYGKASHAGGAPEQGRSALDAVELMNIGANFLREHLIQEARIHYTIEVGGHEPNVVPPYARSWYYVRAPERRQVEEIYNRILRIADGADLMAETSHGVEFLTGCYNTLPNLRLAQLIVANMRAIGAPSYSEEELAFAKEIAKTFSFDEKHNSLRKSKRPGWEKLLDVTMDTSIPDPWGKGESSGGSTDVGDVSWIAPTVEFSTATTPLGTPGHSWQKVACSRVGLGHKSLLFASKTIACTVIDLFTKPEILNEIRKEFAESTEGFRYKTPLPEGLKPPLDILPRVSEK
ncbi:MAG: M20 family metallopeptidase [Nitrososphaerota archaeon]